MAHRVLKIQAENGTCWYGSIYRPGGEIHTACHRDARFETGKPKCQGGNTNRPGIGIDRGTIEKHSVVAESQRDMNA